MRRRCVLLALLLLLCPARAEHGVGGPGPQSQTAAPPPL